MRKRARLAPRPYHDHLLKSAGLKKCLTVESWVGLCEHIRESLRKIFSLFFALHAKEDVGGFFEVFSGHVFTIAQLLN